MTEPNISELSTTARLSRRSKRLAALNSFSSSYANSAFLFWDKAIKEVIDALGNGQNVAICASQGIGKTDFASPEILRRLNSNSPITLAKFFEDASVIEWIPDLQIAIVDEAGRFCTSPRPVIDMDHYSTIDETDTKLGVNASKEDLAYLVEKANQANTLLVLIVPDSKNFHRRSAINTLGEHGIKVVEVNSATLDPETIGNYLRSVEIEQPVIERIVSDNFLLNPTIFCNFVVEILRDSIEHSETLTLEEMEKALKYWTDPLNFPKPTWSRERTDDPWGDINDEALWRINTGSEKDRSDFLTRLNLDLDTLISNTPKFPFERDPTWLPCSEFEDR